MNRLSPGDTRWRVVYLMGRRTPVDPGPWHPDRDTAMGWAAWLESLGHEVFTQSSSGDIYKGRRLIQQAGRLH